MKGLGVFFSGGDCTIGGEVTSAKAEGVLGPLVVTLFSDETPSDLSIADSTVGAMSITGFSASLFGITSAPGTSTTGDRNFFEGSSVL